MGLAPRRRTDQSSSAERCLDAPRSGVDHLSPRRDRYHAIAESPLSKVKSAAGARKTPNGTSGNSAGPPRTLLTIFVGAAVGALVFIVFVAPIVWLRRRRAGAGGAAELPLVPFGVFLAPAALFTLLKGDAAIAWYLSRLGLR